MIAGDGPFLLGRTKSTRLYGWVIGQKVFVQNLDLVVTKIFFGKIGALLHYQVLANHKGPRFCENLILLGIAFHAGRNRNHSKSELILRKEFPGSLQDLLIFQLCGIAAVK